MNVDLFRVIDKYAGVPACLFLSALHKAAPSALCLAPSVPVKRILFVQLSEMGSPILAYPAMVHCKEKHPDAELFFLIFEQNRASVDVLSVIPGKNILTISIKSAWAFLSTLQETVFALRRLSIDTVLDFELFSRFSALICGASGAARRAGFHAFHQEGLYRGSFLTHPVLYNPTQHMTKNFLALAKALEHTGEVPMVKEAITGPFPVPSFHPDQRDVDSVRAKILDLCPQGRAEKLVVVNADAGPLLPFRAWPVEHYAELCRRILDRENAVVALMGLPDAAATNRLVAEGLPRDRVANLTGKTTFAEMFALLSIADLLVTADSGPAHFGALTHTPSVVLFGPETQLLYAPIGSEAACLSSGLSCSPCLSAYNHRKTPCKDAVCMRELSVDTVLAAALEKLGGKSIRETKAS
ncbi:MAG: glycosyltransferase family 9 protein [Thermodesulfobacteriota bacterium]